MSEINTFMSAVTIDGETGVCAVNVYYNGRYIRMNDYKWTQDAIKRPLTEHSLILLSLLAFLSTYVLPGDNLVLYVSNPEVSFEWQKEYTESGRFAKSTKDQDLWKRIINFVKGKKINLTIKGNESPLSSIAELSKRRISRERG